MKNPYNNFSTALSAEFIKKKGTAMFWMSAIIACIPAIVLLIAKLATYTDQLDKRLPYNYHLESTQDVLTAFSSFFLPLTIIVMVTRIAQLDHRNGGWQLMETQPLTKFSIFFAKFTMILIANLVAILSFIASSVLGGFIFSLVYDIPETASMSLPLGSLLLLSGRLFLASLVVTAIQYVLAVKMPSFIWAILLGFGAMLIYLFTSPFKMLPLWYPFGLMDEVAMNKDGSDMGFWFTYLNSFAVVVSAVILYIGYQWYAHKSFRMAFISSSRRSVGTFAVIVVGAALTYWIMMPNQMGIHNKTVLAGKVESPQKFKIAHLTNQVVGDTIATFRLKDNEFKTVLSDSLIPDFYLLTIDGKHRFYVYIGAKDSVYINTGIMGGKTDATITGTRIAENQYKEEQSMFSTVGYYIKEKMFMEDPQKIADELYDEWKDGFNESSSFRTVDNYIPKDDFLQLQKKLISVRYLSMWTTYVNNRKVLVAGEKTVEPKQIAEMRKTISLTDESLFGNDEYFSFIRSELMKKNEEDIDEDTKALIVISDLPKGGFKDKMLFKQLEKSIGETESSAERQAIIANHKQLFSNDQYVRKILAFNRMVESLAKGKPAPLFNAVSNTDKIYTLDQFKGKYVLIDVWATWCGPCKQESPYFEKLAIKYKSQKNIQFIALSVDQDVREWYIDVAKKSKSVLQLHTNDPQGFSTAYNAESIPRFIMIDPNGNFINASMPRPSDDTFEMILRKELGLPEL